MTLKLGGGVCLELISVLTEMDRPEFATLVEICALVLVGRDCVELHEGNCRGRQMLSFLALEVPMF